MEHPFTQLFEEYGIYAVFALCTVEGDITLLLSGVMAHNNSFGSYSFLQVYLAGTLGGMIGDNVGYWVGRFFRTSVKDYRFYEMARPRIERLIDKFGGFSIIVSKYIYGLRVAMCLFNGIGRMPFGKFLLLDFISCSIWVLFLSGAGYFFSGAVTNIIGDAKKIGVWVFFIVLAAILIFYLVERYLLSHKIEEANPETIHKIEEKLHTIEEKLHLTISPNHDKKSEDEAEEKADETSEEKAKAAKE